MNPYRGFSATATGGTHSKHGKGCQDCSLHSGEGGPATLAVVADGHGEDNCFRADRGSTIAAQCANQGLLDFVKNADQPPSEGSIREIIKHIVARWQITVEEDHTKNPFTPEELAKADEKHRKRYEEGKRLYKAYGTTLIAAVITADYWFGFHIGDGRLTALYKDGGFDQPVPWDDKCFLNQTTSICDDDAADRARCYLSFHQKKEPPAVVFLCSDGVDDNYPVDDNEKHLFKLYRTIALTFAEDGFESTCKQLEDLANSFATKGKGDDTSIAGFIDMEGVKHAAPVWRKQIAQEEAQSAEAERAKAAAAVIAQTERAKTAATKAEAALKAAAEKTETAKAEIERFKGVAEKAQAAKAEAERAKAAAEKAEAERAKAEAAQTEADLAKAKESLAKAEAACAKAAQVKQEPVQPPDADKPAQTPSEPDSALSEAEAHKRRTAISAYTSQKGSSEIKEYGEFETKGKEE